MDFSNEDFELNKLLSKKVIVDNITPHKIAVVAFIREFGLLKLEFKTMNDCNIAPNYRKDFCILALKLIQCPDLDFKELESLLSDGKYNLTSVHLQNFCICLQTIYSNGVSALTDCVTTTIEKLMTDQSETCPAVITTNSVIGFYLRRIKVNLDKLTFSQIVSLHKAFCHYYKKGRPGFRIRSLSKEKLDKTEQQSSAMAMSPVHCESKQPELSQKSVVIDKDPFVPFEHGQWSRKQAELFTAQQALLMQTNEEKALPPKELQRIILEIIHDIPDYSEAHYLSFLNCMRIKEFSGAQDSLCSCFDRSMFSSSFNNVASNDRNKHFRYAALNRAAMHTHFGHKSLALEGVREATTTAQEAGDAACVATAAAWAAASGAPPLAAPAAPRPPRLAVLHCQLRARTAALAAALPADVFALVAKSDSINYMHSMTDMTLASLANTAALWSHYGKTEMASVYCQLLLNLNTKCGGGACAWGSAHGVAAEGVWRAAAARGHSQLAASLLSHLRDYGLRARAYSYQANNALYAGSWDEAEQNIMKLASYDRWESQYLRGKLHFLKGNPSEAIDALEDIVENCKTSDDSLHYMSFRLRALLVMAQVQQAYGENQTKNNGNILLLNDVLTNAKKYHLYYYAATAEMLMANIQLRMGRAKMALDITRKVLPTILAHGGAYDIGRGLLLYTKCKLANAPSEGQARVVELECCCAILENVKKNFLKINANGRLLETYYLQAHLYNELGNLPMRNQCSWMFRELDTQHNIDNFKNILALY